MSAVTIGTVGAPITLCPCCGWHDFKQACGACGFEGPHHATWSGKGLDRNPVGDVGHHRRRLWTWFHEVMPDAESVSPRVLAALRGTDLEALERRLVDRLIDQGPRPKLQPVTLGQVDVMTLDTFLGTKSLLHPVLGGLAAYHVPRHIREHDVPTVRALLVKGAHTWQAKASHSHMTVAELVEALLAAWVQHHDPRVVAARKYGLLAYAREDDGVGPLALSWVEEMV